MEKKENISQEMPQPRKRKKLTVEEARRMVEQIEEAYRRNGLRRIKHDDTPKDDGTVFTVTFRRKK